MTSEFEYHKYLYCRKCFQTCMIACVVLTSTTSLILQSYVATLFIDFLSSLSLLSRYINTHVYIYMYRLF